MRLINTNTLLFEDFIGQDIPAYAILSHTWGPEEVTFQAMVDPSSRSLKGYKKIEMTCRLAKAAGLSYAWIDTCCIDKSSSAELTEAVNAMFRWYKRSAICYVYLEDLHADEPWLEFQKCRWLTRGWTLQELIAPAIVHFYDGMWNFRTTKSDSINNISAITGVSQSILRHIVPLRSVSVAQRMSWSAARQTTRIEDRAYCLFGIFNVNMPLLYGEEERAFIRLQVEIMRQGLDFSIFAWKIPLSPETQHKPETALYSGVLAQSPAWFYDSRRLNSLWQQMANEFGVENQGIKLDARFLFEKHPKKRGTLCVLPVSSSTDDYSIGVALRHVGQTVFVRSKPHEFFKLDMSCWSMTWPHVKRYLLPQLPEIELGDPPPSVRGRELILEYRKHAIDFIFPEQMTIREDVVWPISIWDSEDQAFFLPQDPSSDGAAATLGIRGAFSGSIRGKPFLKEVDCFIFALGWGRAEDIIPQFTLLDPSQIGTSSINEIYCQFGLYDYRSSLPVKQALRSCGILQKSYVAHDIGDLNHTLLIWCIAKKVTESLLCQSSFWRLEMLWRIVPSCELPDIFENGFK